MNPTERQSKSRKARRDAGLVPLTVWVPKVMADPLRRYITAQVELHRLAKEWRTIPTPPVTATMIAEMEKNTPKKRQSDEPAEQRRPQIWEAKG
jgi:hypothetical protein